MHSVDLLLLKLNDELFRENSALFIQAPLTQVLPQPLRRTFHVLLKPLVRQQAVVAIVEAGHAQARRAQ